MNRQHLIPLALAVCAATFGPLALAQTMQRDQTQTQAQERIYGSQLMTEQERSEHMNRLREMKTEQEREQYRQEHHQRMLERAKERGVKLPDEVPAQGRRAGPGNRPGVGGTGGGGAKGR